MKTDLYQAETKQLALRHQALLSDARGRILKDDILSPLEEQGLLHSLQIIIENAIGKSKHLLKRQEHPIPVSAYDCFEQLHIEKMLSLEELHQWKGIIGLRNAIVHEYMAVNMDLIYTVIREEAFLFAINFLCKPFSDFS